MLKHDATYLIIGGTGGIGCAIASRMIKRGASHIVLLSRSGTITPAVSKLIDDAQEQSAAVHVEQCDVADKTAVGRVVAKLKESMPPVRGIIHAAMVLRVS